MRVLILGLAYLAVIGTTRLSGQSIQSGDEPAQNFFARHCQACHTGLKPKGRFHLDSLSPDFSDKANRERWLAVLEQVKSGTMPPKEKPRPPAQEVRAVSDWIQARVEKGAAAANAKQGRVVLRRLNRTEYENTVRDLLGVDLDLKDLLPPDTSTNGFDNRAEALHVSSFLMEQYLEAADAVLDAAIANGPRPTTIKKTLRHQGRKVRQTEGQRLSPSRRRRGHLQLVGLGQYPGHAVELPQPRSGPTIASAFPATAIKRPSRSPFM